MSKQEQHLSKLKQAIDTANLDKQKSLREAEENKHERIFHLKQLHSNKVRSLQTSHDNLQDESKRKILKLEETIKEKDNNMARMQKQHEEHNQQKLREVSQKYEETKKALEIEMQKERKQLKMKKNQKLTALKNSYDNNRADAEQMAKTRQDSDVRTIVDLEHTVSKLGDEILQANQIRKQQLIELSVLREEEKQKKQKGHEEQMTILESQYEEKLRIPIPVSVPQNLESMISTLQDQVSSLKHHNTVLAQLSNMHDCKLSAQTVKSTKVTALHSTKPLVSSTKSPGNETNVKTSTKHTNSEDCVSNATDNDVYGLTVMRKMRKTVMMRIMMRRKKRKRKQRSRS